MKCVLCGTENNDELDVCSKCGKKLNNNPVTDKLNFLKNDKAITEEVIEDVVEVDNHTISNDNNTTDVVVKNGETSNEDKVSSEESQTSNTTIITETLSEIVEVTEDNEIIVSDVTETVIASQPIIEEKAPQKKSFKEFKGKRPSIFTKRNLILVSSALVLVILLIAIIFNMLFSEKPTQPAVAYDSLGTLNVHNSYKNDTTELISIDKNFEYELMKSTNGLIFYPTNTQFVDGITKFDINKSDQPLVTSAQYDYMVSKDGRYIVYFKNIKNLYGDNVADMFYVDTEKDSVETIIDNNVIISTVKISDNSKDMIFVKPETFELCRFTLGKSKVKVLDDSIDEIIYSSDDLKNILYVKPQKQVNDMFMYTLYSAIDNSTNKIATNVLKDSIYYGDTGVLFLKAPDKYPDFNIFDDATKNLSKKEIKALKEEFDAFCTKNFFSLYVSDLKGKTETEVAENVYLLNFVSKNGNGAIITKFKDITTIDQKTIKKLDDLISPKNLEAFAIDSNQALVKLDRKAVTTLLGIGENYGFDSESNDIYYIDGDNLIKLTYGTTYEPSVLDTGVKKLWFTDSTLAYLKGDGSLYQATKGSAPTLVAENILTNSVVLSNNCLYYEQKQKDDITSLFVKVNDDKPKKLSDNLVKQEIVAFENYAYFIDEKDGLSFFNGKKAKELDKNSSEVYILTNDLSIIEN